MVQKTQTSTAKAAASSDLQEVLSHLRTLLPSLRERHDVETLEAFGPRVRGEGSSESELGLLVTFRRTPGFLGLMALENEISDALGIPVDLVVRRALRAHSRDRILEEAITVETEQQPLDDAVEDSAALQSRRYLESIAEAREEHRAGKSLPLRDRDGD